MKTNKKVDSSTITKDLLKESILKASQTKKAVEEIVRAQLLESLSPSIRNVLNSSLAEMDDFDIEDDMDEAQESDEEIVDFEEEVPAEAGGEEEVPAEAEGEEDLEESESDMSADEEEFLRELQSVLESDDDDDDYEGDAPVEEEEVIEESEESEEEVIEESEDISKDEPKDEKKLVSENKKLRKEIEELRKGLNEVNRMLNESSLDVKRTESYNRIVKLSRLSEAQKMRVMKQLDKATNDKDIKKLEESYTALFRKPAVKKVAPKVNKAGSSQIKKLSESTKPTPKVLNESFSNRLAELAGIETK